MKFFPSNPFTHALVSTGRKHHHAESWKVLQEVPNHDQGPLEGSNSYTGERSPYGVSLRSAGLQYDPIPRSRKVSAEPEPCLLILNVFQYDDYFCYIFGIYSKYIY